MDKAKEIAGVNAKAIAAFVVLLVAGLGRYGIEMPPDVQAAVETILLWLLPLITSGVVWYVANKAPPPETEREELPSIDSEDVE